MALVLVLLAGCTPEEPPAEAGAAGPAAREPAAETTEPADPPVPVERDWPAGELRADGGMDAELAPGGVHVYRLPLEAGQFLRLRVDQHGVDVVLILRDPGGELLLRADRMFNDRGPELVMAVARTSGVHTLTLEADPRYGPGRYRSHVEAFRPASDRDRQRATAYREFREAEELPRAQAIDVWEGTLTTWRALGEAALEGEVLARLGIDHYIHAEWEASAERFRQALAVLARAGDPGWEAVFRIGFAGMLAEAGRVEEALEQYRTGLALARDADDTRNQAAALRGLGKTYQRQAEIQQALSHYEAALAILPETDRTTRPYALHDLGVLYSAYFGDPERARELLIAARDLWRDTLDHRRWKARTLSHLARIAREGGRLQEARSLLEDALAVPEGYDPCGRATQLARLAVLEDESGRRRRADSRLADAFELVEERACPRNAVTVPLLAGLVAESRGEAAVALERFERGRELAAEQGDRTRVADGFAGVARARRALGQGEEALEASRHALAILEEVRPTVLREDLRTAFFSTAQEQFDFHIDLSVVLGHDAEAWLTAERARAQALRDLLGESRFGLRQEADPGLLDRERTLQRRLNDLEARRTELLQGEIDALVEQLEAVRGEIRRDSPVHAAMVLSEPLSVPRLQGELLDPDTLLLEYRLGEGASWLWAITRDSLETFTLPPRQEIEAIAREAVHWTRSLRWSDRNPAAVCDLSRLVLGPVAQGLAGRRLVVVADGALEEVSFAALPSPADRKGCSEAAPLVARHEIVHLPSVATLATQRHALSGREPSSGWLAMVADPVYGPDDPRLRPSAGARRASYAESSGGATGSGRRFRRLRHSGEEADVVLAGLPGARTFLARGLDASKQTVTGGFLGDHRIVHFAIHGVLDAEQPLLSYLALSGSAPDGTPAADPLYAHEIYALDLPAELVVLSACDTARGRQVRGEGLVSGLPRAFLYAGAARVLVSLWPVQDRSTRDLMELFYRGLIGKGLPPGRALQEAQRALWRDGRPPYQWAGFVLQGDWRPLPPF